MTSPHGVRSFEVLSRALALPSFPTTTLKSVAPSAWTALFALAFAFGASSSLMAAPVYYIKDLGAAPGYLAGGFSTPHAINNLGEVVGVTRQNDAFKYSNGVLSVISPPTSSYSSANAINDLSQVAGTAGRVGGSTNLRNAILWNGVSITNLGAPGGVRDEVAFDLNNMGQIVGRTSTGIASDSAFIYQNGAMTLIPTLGGNIGQAVAINDAGRVVGSSHTLSGSGNLDYSFRGFLYENGVITELASLGGRSGAVDINNSGQILGYSADVNGFYHTVVPDW